MEMMNNTEIIAQIAALLSKLIENNNAQQDNKPAVHENAPVEMLTIKECAEAVSGLSEHTIRSLWHRRRFPISAQVKASGERYLSTRRLFWSI